MTSFCDNIADIFVQKDIIAKDERDVYRYGIEALMSTIFGAMLVIMVGIIMQEILGAVLFYIITLSTRVYTGGYHADTHVKCKTLLTTLCCCILGLSQLMCVLNVSELVAIPFLLVEIWVLAICAPIENEKKHIPKVNLKRFKTISIYVFFFWVVISFFVGGFHVRFFWITQISVNSIVLLMLYEILENRRYR